MQEGGVKREIGEQWGGGVEGNQEFRVYIM